MAIVAGIDEAGYGPMLGPLVVSATAFRMPDEAVDQDLWKRFRRVVTRKSPKRLGKVWVADSKLIHSGPNGLKALEQNLLPFLGMHHKFPATCWELVHNCSCGELKHRHDYPWYRGREVKVPYFGEAERLLESSKELRDGLVKAGGEFCQARAETVDVAEFNLEMKQAGWKSVVLARRVAALLQNLWQTFKTEGMFILVDRQGGRKSYSPFLRAVFEGAAVETCLETAKLSEYTVSLNGHSARIRFEVKGDSLHLPVALASMLSKYTRELHMIMLNEYWCERLPGLKPTAGYYGDGRRFLSDIEAALIADKVPADIIKRCK